MPGYLPPRRPFVVRRGTSRRGDGPSPVLAATHCAANRWTRSTGDRPSASLGAGRSPLRSMQSTPFVRTMGSFGCGRGGRAASSSAVSAIAFRLFSSSPSLGRHAAVQPSPLRPGAKKGVGAPGLSRGARFFSLRNLRALRVSALVLHLCALCVFLRGLCGCLSSPPFGGTDLAGKTRSCGPVARRGRWLAWSAGERSTRRAHVLWFCRGLPPPHVTRPRGVPIGDHSFQGGFWTP